jgi:hypothetical protein
MEDIFRVHSLKLKYECVQYIHEESRKEYSFIYDISKEMWDYYFFLVRGFSPNIEEQKDSISGGNSGEAENVKPAGEFTVPFWGDLKSEDAVPVKSISKEELNRYIEQLNCTPEQALNEYKRLIRDIKSQKELYLNCIDAELTKGDLSEYAKVGMKRYKFLEPGMSVMGLPRKFTKLDFLKVFKEFILNDNEEVLPDGVRVHAYLKCGCKIP